MSRMLPQRTVDCLRVQGDVSLANYGIDCDLYIPTNLDEVETVDVYAKPKDYEYVHYTAKVFIEWTPNMWRLKKFGIYTEHETPILGRFGRKAVNDAGVEVDVDIHVNSFIKVALQYIPSSVSDTDQFEIVSVAMGNFHDAAIVQIYKLAPLRGGDRRVI